MLYKLLCAVFLAQLADAYTLVPRAGASACIAQPLVATARSHVLVMADDADAAKAAKAKAAKAKAAKAVKAKAAKAPKAKEGDAEAEETPEEKAAREEEEKKKAEAEAKKKAEAAAKKKREAEAAAKKKAGEVEESVSCLTDAALVLTKTVALNPTPATISERCDFLREKGIPEASIQEALSACKLQEEDYQRDAWGRIVARNDVKYNPNATPPPSDAFGQLRVSK